MPFGFKICGDQRAMVTLFQDMMHKEIEIYVDDKVAKSGEEENHVQILKKLFESLSLRFNPVKCPYVLKSGKFVRICGE